MATNGSREGSDLVLDCAATSHMFTDADYFTQYTPSMQPETISVGDGHPCRFLGEAVSLSKVDFRMVFGQSSFTESLHVPRLRENLISLGKLEREGAYGTFGGGCIKVMMGTEELFPNDTYRWTVSRRSRSIW
jgi:hypothetical protein